MSVDEVRKKLNMDDPKDVEAWDCLMDIQKTPHKDLIMGMVGDMQAELSELDAQVDTMEKLRVKHLFTNEVLSKQAEDSLKILRKERDELRETLQSKTYKGVGGGSGSRAMETW
jgi:hypothetical protein